jgi:uncharacterized membrane protein YsdA (DUF1294 family)
LLLFGILVKPEMEIQIKLEYFLYYLLIINIISIIVFYADKRNAINKKYRTAETKLHLFEMIGGVFIILPMLYTIKHKNRKSSYFSLTYLIFIIWILLLVFVIRFEV